MATGQTAAMTTPTSAIDRKRRMEREKKRIKEYD